IIDFCLTEKGKPLKSSIQKWHQKSKDKAVIDFAYHLQISEINEDVLKEIPLVIEEEGVTSFKVFMAYKNVLQADDETLFRTLITAKKHDALVMVHAENGDVIDYLTKKALEEGNTEPIYHALTRPPEVEGEATGRAAKLTALADSQLYVVHVTCKEAVEQIAEARKKGLRVWGKRVR
ncbi:dihydropyrimidinase, partial [Klebsiella pneumoniae]